jgi:hypothetical protein
MNLLRELSHKFSIWNRRKKLKFVLSFIRQHEVKSCLIVGASSDATGDGFVNLIERGIKIEITNVVASGLEAKSTSWSTWRQEDGRNLTFGPKEFDLVFSNAVIEHVGDERDQIRFVSEHDRVGKSWIFTTPNRWFPIESHTQILFSHMRKSWRHPLVSRLLSKADLRKILPPGSNIKGGVFSPTFICYKVQN